MARAPRRIHLSDVQPDSRPHRVSKRGASAAAYKTFEVAAQAARRNCVVCRRACRSHAPLSAATLWRTGAACDEPTGDLDRKSATEIMQLIEELVAKHGKTVLMVTHDPVVADRAHTTLHLEKGVLVEGSKLPQNAMAGGVA